jgi:hypothetical protein
MRSFHTRGRAPSPRSSQCEEPRARLLDRRDTEHCLPVRLFGVLSTSLRAFSLEDPLCGLPGPPSQPGDGGCPVARRSL